MAHPSPAELLNQIGKVTKYHLFSSRLFSLKYPYDKLLTVWGRGVIGKLFMDLFLSPSALLSGIRC